MAGTIITAVGPLELNHATIGALLNGEFGMAGVLQGEGDKVLGAAKAAAPVVTGTYQASLYTRVYHTDRMVVNVASDLDYAPAVERKHHTLTKALGASSGKPGRKR